MSPVAPAQNGQTQMTVKEATNDIGKQQATNFGVGMVKKALEEATKARQEKKD